MHNNLHVKLSLGRSSPHSSIFFPHEMVIFRPHSRTQPFESGPIDRKQFPDPDKCIRPRKFLLKRETTKKKKKKKSTPLIWKRCSRIRKFRAKLSFQEKSDKAIQLFMPRYRNKTFLRMFIYRYVMRAPRTFNFI